MIRVWYTCSLIILAVSGYVGLALVIAGATSLIVTRGGRR